MKVALDDGRIFKLVPSQIASLRKLARNTEKDESTLLTPGKYGSLKRLGLVVTYRTGLFRGTVPAYLTGLGAKVWAAIPTEAKSKDRERVGEDTHNEKLQRE